MSRPFFCLAAALSLAGCAVASHPAPDPSRYPQAFLARPAAVTSAGPFWAQFSDPVLAGLLFQAESANGDLRSAAARLGQARAARAGLRATSLPEVGWSAQAQRRSGAAMTGTVPGPRESSLFDTTFDARWELDLFGRLDQEARAGALDAEAAAMDAEAIRISVLAETGRLYFAVRSLQLRLEVVGRSAVTQGELARLVRSRARSGLVPEIDAIQADALAAASQARAHDLRAQLADTVAALALVAGRTAGDIDEAVAAPAALPDVASPLLGSPADLLSRRYDIRRDIALLASADARTAARLRDRLPRLTLTAVAGSSAMTTGSLFTAEAGIFSVVGAVAGPVLDFGRRQAAADRALAEADERAAILQTTVLTAIREIERDASAVNQLGMRLQFVETEAARNRTAEQLLNARYIAGLESLSRVLDANRQALASAETELIVREAQLASALSLWKSLGGPDASRSRLESR
jgi:NodT family efflux transporter outer membrane factor (OMF) lipoprotein